MNAATNIVIATNESPKLISVKVESYPKRAKF
jgi:hypothetical protein